LRSCDAGAQGSLTPRPRGRRMQRVSMEEETPAKVRTCLWFDGDAEEAVRLYTTVVPRSVVEATNRADPDGPVSTIRFTLAGTPYLALNGGPSFAHTPAASIVVGTSDQEETDRFWTELTSDGGRAGQCGWLTDRFGVSWQVVPIAFTRMMESDDRAAARRAADAMMKMSKLDIARLAQAFAGVELNA